MSENQPPAPSTTAAPATDIPGQPFYDKTRQHLRELLHKRKILERSLAVQEEAIYKKETDYLEDTPAGNIIVGFESYTKGVGTMAGGRGRNRGGVGMEGSRLFSRSSVSYNVNAESPNETAQSTPIATAAPTPINTSFLKEGGASNHATPTSATSGNKVGAAAGGNKKNKKGANGNAGDDDSEIEREGGNKKIRTNFGAVRK